MLSEAIGGLKSANHLWTQASACHALSWTCPNEAYCCPGGCPSLLEGPAGPWARQRTADVSPQRGEDWECRRPGGWSVRTRRGKHCTQMCKSWTGSPTHHRSAHKILLGKKTGCFSQRNFLILDTSSAVNFILV